MSQGTTEVLEIVVSWQDLIFTGASKPKKPTMACLRVPVCTTPILMETDMQTSISSAVLSTIWHTRPWRRDAG